MTRPLTDSKLYLQLDRATHAKLKAYGLATGNPMTVLGAEILAGFFQQRAELGEQITSDGSEPAPIIPELLAAIEERIVATIDRQAEQVVGMREMLQELRVMVQLFVLSYLQHTPELSAEWKNKARQSGSERYAKWQEAVKAAL